MSSLPDRLRDPVGLRDPVDLALANAVEKIPAPGTLSGGLVAEPKWDGYLH